MKKGSRWMAIISEIYWENNRPKTWKIERVVHERNGERLVLVEGRWYTLERVEELGYRVKLYQRY